MEKSLRQKIEGVIKSLRLAWTLYSARPTVNAETNPEPLVDTFPTEDYNANNRLDIDEPIIHEPLGYYNLKHDILKILEQSRLEDYVYFDTIMKQGDEE